jgi:hypothetical protein
MKGAVGYVPVSLVALALIGSTAAVLFDYGRTDHTDFDPAMP